MALAELLRHESMMEHDWRGSLPRSTFHKPKPSSLTRTSFSHGLTPLRHSLDCLRQLATQSLKKGKSDMILVVLSLSIEACFSILNV